MVVFTVVVGCGGVAPLPPEDAARQDVAPDVALDTAPDAPLDVVLASETGTDVVLDVALVDVQTADVAPDAPLDVVQDASVDVAPEAMADVSTDSPTLDVGDAGAPDAGSDAGSLVDASPDAPEAPLDASADVGTDNGTDTGPVDVGCLPGPHLQTDPNNCGVCGRVCPAGSLPNTYAVCDQGVCRNNACVPGFTDCDGEVRNGCETDVRADITNCGGCFVICTLRANQNNAVCSNSRCSATCNTGFFNCDGNLANGCESTRPCP